MNFAGKVMFPVRSSVYVIVMVLPLSSISIKHYKHCGIFASLIELSHDSMLIKVPNVAPR